MRIRPSGIVLVACAAVAFAGPQLAMPMSSAAAASPASSGAPAHHLRAPAEPPVAIYRNRQPVEAV